MSDAQARSILVGEWPGQSLASYQIVQAIGRFEGQYGSAFVDPTGIPAHNWGASQPTTAEEHGGVCPVGTVPTPDTKADGTRYTACIEQFATHELGARALVRALTVRRPRVAVELPTGNALAVAVAMHQAPHPYMAAPPARYARAIARNARAIARSLREPLRVFLPDGGGGVVTVLLAAIAAGFIGSRIRRARIAP